MKNEIQEILDKHKVKVITKFEQIEEILNFESIKSEEPIIYTKDNTIIIFDNPDYEKAFLHENLDNVISNKDSIHNIISIPDNYVAEQKAAMYGDLQNKLNIAIPHTSLLYCNDAEISNKMFYGFFENLHKNTERFMQNKNPEFVGEPFEFKNPPIILIINANVNAVFIDFEKVMPFNNETFINSFLTLITAETILAAHKNTIKKQKEAQSASAAIFDANKKSNFQA